METILFLCGIIVCLSVPIGHKSYPYQLCGMGLRRICCMPCGKENVEYTGLQQYLE